MKKGLAKPGKLELAHAAIEFGEHGVEDGIFFSVGAGGRAFGGAAERRRSARTIAHRPENLPMRETPAEQLDLEIGAHV